LNDTKHSGFLYLTQRRDLPFKQLWSAANEGVFIFGKLRTNLGRLTTHSPTDWEAEATKDYLNGSWVIRTAVWFLWESGLSSPAPT